MDVARTKNANRILAMLAWIGCSSLLLLCGVGSTLPPHVTHVFTDSDNTRRGVFKELVVDWESGAVFIGGTNKLYRLSSTLNLEQAQKTGPVPDHPDCVVSTKCDKPKQPTDSINKALVIDQREKCLIQCDTVKQGICVRRDLVSLEMKDPECDMPHCYPIAPSDGQTPIVAFLGSNKTGDQLLFVAASRASVGRSYLRDAKYAMSIRNPKNFGIVFQNPFTFKKSVLQLDSWVNKEFEISYVSGFAAGNFAYWLAVQPQDPSVPALETHLVRVCSSDKYFASYAELPLSCTDPNGGDDYKVATAAAVARPGMDLARRLSIKSEELALFVTFARPYDDKELKVKGEAGLCVYRMRDIVSQFTSAIQNCFDGVGNTGPSYFGGEDPCIDRKVTITDEYCGEHSEHHNNPILAAKLETAAVATWEDAVPSSLNVTSTGDYTVAFVGTQQGHVKKISVASGTEGAVYDDIEIAPGHNITAIAFDKSHAHVYALADNTLYRLWVQECARHSTCGACLGARDPYCGWCTLEQKCTVRAQCNNNQRDLRWLPYSGAQCPAVADVRPGMIQIQAQESTIQLQVQTLPSPNTNQYFCKFASVTEKSRATVSTTGQDCQKPGYNCLDCKTPQSYQLPRIPTGQDAVSLKLSVTTSSDVTLADVDFVFYDCARHTSCTTCTSSAYPCRWCVGSNVCTHSPGENCRTPNEVMITSNAVQNSARSGPEKCPRIEFSSKEIPVPSGTNYTVSVDAVNLQAEFQSDYFKCWFDIDGKGGKLVGARKQVIHGRSPKIICSPITFSYAASTVSHRNVVFKVFWDTDHTKALDNPYNVQVQMYKCEAMASNCGLCLSADARYDCGWCMDRATNRCTIAKACPSYATNFASWLVPSRDTCPDPLIQQVTPMTGPVAGGTLVTLTGINLGRTASELQGKVKVGGQTCTILDERYEPASKIVCRTGSVMDARDDVIVVQVGKYTTSYADVFSYVEPRLESISRTKSPASGGASVTIRGSHLKSGSEQRVRVNLMDSSKFVPCSIDNKTHTDTSITCRIAGSPEGVSKGKIEVLIDDSVTTFSSQDFGFVKDPVVSVMDPDPLWTIESGGIRVKGEGERLDAVQTTRLFIQLTQPDGTHTRTYAPCNVTSATTFTCYTPSVRDAAAGDSSRSRRGAPTVPGSVIPPISTLMSFGIEMDNVKSVVASGNPLWGNITVFPDPKFFEFDDVKPVSEEIVIEGENLKPLRDHDYVIRLGRDFCNHSSTAVSGTRVTCKPPSAAPQPLPGDDLPLLVVYVGAYVNHSIGYVAYEAQGPGGGGGTSLPVVVGAVVAVLVVVVIAIIIIVVIVRRKNAKGQRNLRQVRNQMDQLELRVAKECKEAFAELQTEVPELTREADVTIPFLDYKTFCMRVLFPSASSDHPVLCSDHDVSLDLLHPQNAERAQVTRKFSNLLFNKHFLLCFIRTLESERAFTMRDRVNVASLLSVALLPRMEYQTEILQELLAELIERSVEQKNQQLRKLLLRRTESVAEKMLTNWFTMLLYRFLRDCAGEPLYLLFLAIKQQVDKGPVDACTGEAKYSLSEDKLLRQQTSYKTLTVRVRNMTIPDYGGSGSLPDLPVKVLDCDTISQVKEKLLDAQYRNLPYSSRPSKDSLDLEWVTGRQGKTILMDEDMVTTKEGNWKKLNTLQTYNVPDGAVLSFVPKATSGNYNHTIGSDSSRGGAARFDNALYQSFSGSPHLAAARALPSTGVLDLDREARFHLVKHEPETNSGDGKEGKMVSEIYLPRLLATKGILQPMVDDLLETVFSTNNRSSSLPFSIKFMFDFLDHQAALFGIQDPDVVHTWKSNSLPLRFWVNVIKNPQFVFDINKSGVVDACLSVVATTLMDSCSVGEHHLSKDSPSSKLLYARDIPRFKTWVRRYNQDVRQMPAINPQDMAAALNDVSRAHAHDFNTLAAVRELLRYAVSYQGPLMKAVAQDELCRRARVLDHLRPLLAAAADSEATSTYSSNTSYSGASASFSQV